MRYIISLALASLPLSALAEVPQVVTDIPPVHALVAQVMGALGSPTLLLEKGADEHDFQLRPSQMQAIADADAAIWVSPVLTPWLERALAESPAASLTLLDAPGTQTQPYAMDHGGHAGYADHSADEYDQPEPSHDKEGADPHAWMNPVNAAHWTDLIAAELSRQDPENAATYSANATTTKARIKAMDAEIAAQLAPLQGKAFVSFHAAYGYFTTHYGLAQAGSLALGDASTPGAARLTALQAEMQAGNYACAFPEIQHDPALLEQVMAGSAVKLGAALDPVGSSLDFGPDAYDTLMRSLANTLTDCLKN